MPYIKLAWSESIIILIIFIPLCMDRQTSSWASMKHEPAKRSDVENLIRNLLEKELQIPQNPPIPLINLGLGKSSIVSYHISRWTYQS